MPDGSPEVKITYNTEHPNQWTVKPLNSSPIIIKNGGDISGLSNDYTLEFGTTTAGAPIGDGVFTYFYDEAHDRKCHLEKPDGTHLEDGGKIIPGTIYKVFGVMGFGVCLGSIEFSSVTTIQGETIEAITLKGKLYSSSGG